jgi:hypothetical protein
MNSSTVGASADSRRDETGRDGTRRDGKCLPHVALLYAETRFSVLRFWLLASEMKGFVRGVKSASAISGSKRTESKQNKLKEKYRNVSISRRCLNLAYCIWSHFVVLRSTLQLLVTTNVVPLIPSTLKILQEAHGFTSQKTSNLT